MTIRCRLAAAAPGNAAPRGDGSSGCIALSPFSSRGWPGVISRIHSGSSGKGGLDGFGGIRSPAQHGVEIGVVSRDQHGIGAEARIRT